MTDCGAPIVAEVGTSESPCRTGDLWLNCRLKGLALVEPVLGTDNKIGPDKNELQLRQILEPFCPRPGFQKRLGSVSSHRVIAFSRLQDFAEFFAELCALHAPIAPITPFYSVENITTPAFSPRLLTEVL